MWVFDTSHDASDFSHVHAQFCIQYQVGISPQSSLRGHRLPHCACTQNWFRLVWLSVSHSQVGFRICLNGNWSRKRSRQGIAMGRETHSIVWSGVWVQLSGGGLLGYIAEAKCSPMLLSCFYACLPPCQGVRPLYLAYVCSGIWPGPELSSPLVKVLIGFGFFMVNYLCSFCIELCSNPYAA